LYYELHTKAGVKGGDEKDYEVVIKFDDEEFGKVDYAEFMKKVDTKSYDQGFINDYCQFDTTSDGSSSALLYLTIVLACFTLALLVVVIVMCVRRRKMNLTTQSGYKSIV
jgi:hypothetical protein